MSMAVLFRAAKGLPRCSQKGTDSSSVVSVCTCMHTNVVCVHTHIVIYMHNCITIHPLKGQNFGGILLREQALKNQL